MTEALFVLSTGRCGTQWLAESLRSALGDRVEVTHEPLDHAYSPRAMLAAGDPSRLDAELAEPILAHVAEIETTLATRPYIECGHPSWSSIPFLLRRFAGRVRIVHLVRHPVPTAWSWVTQRAYCPPVARHLEEKVLLSPFDEGAQFHSFRSRWPELEPYEKALFYWAEVNASALRLERATDVPWVRLRFEDLFRADSLSRLIDFAGLDADPTPPTTSKVVDEFHCFSGFWSDSLAIVRHPEVLEVAATLGYDPLEFDDAKLRRRYAGL